MLNLYKYTDTEKKKLVDSIVILIDTREKKNKHITDYFDKKNIKWKSKKLDYGDYSFYLPKSEELNIPRDLYFDKKVIIERKGSLEEISGNLTKGRDRFEKELSLSPKRKVILIENGSLEDIVKNQYDTQYNNKSFVGSLFAFWFRYDVPIFFLKNKNMSGLFIRLYFEYYIKDIFK